MYKAKLAVWLTAATVAFAILGSTQDLASAGSAPTLSIWNQSGQGLRFELRPNSKNARWGNFYLAAGQKKVYSGTQGSNSFTVKIKTRNAQGWVYTKSYLLRAGMKYKVLFINGIFDFRHYSTASKGNPTLTVQNLAGQQLRFELKPDGGRWNTFSIGNGQTKSYYGTRGSSYFTVKIATRTRWGRLVTKQYRLQAGMRYRLYNVRGVFDFRRY